MPGSTIKICPTCQASIGVASKKCKFCGASQPYKLLKQKKLEKAKQRIQECSHVLKANAVKVVDAAYVHLHNLQAAGYFPILLLGKKKGSKVRAELLTVSESPSIQEQMANKAICSEFEKLLKVHFDGTTCVTTAPSTNTISTTSPPVCTQPITTSSISVTFPHSNSTSTTLSANSTSISSTNLSSTSVLQFSPPTSLKGKEDGMALQIVPSSEEKREKERKREMNKQQKHNCTPAVGLQVDTDNQEKENIALQKKKEQLEPPIDLTEEADSIYFPLSPLYPHQVPISPLSLDPTFPIISGHSTITVELDSFNEAQNESMVPSSNVEDESSGLMGDLPNSTTLDLNAFNLDLGTMDLFPVGNGNDVVIFYAPSAATQESQDNTEEGLARDNSLQF